MDTSTLSHVSFLFNFMTEQANTERNIEIFCHIDYMSFHSQNEITTNLVTMIDLLTRYHWGKPRCYFVVRQITARCGREDLILFSFLSFFRWLLGYYDGDDDGTVMDDFFSFEELNIKKEEKDFSLSFAFMTVMTVRKAKTIRIRARPPTMICTLGTSNVFHLLAYSTEYQNTNLCVV